MNLKSKENLYLGIFSILLLALAYPLISKINFMQNDDWVHYRTVLRFLDGNFTLEPVIGSTFYVQGVLGYVFSRFFSFANLPFLTLLISLGNFFVFYFILKNLKVKSHIAVLTGLLVLFNPLHLYLSLGFMIENYLLFFMLVSLLFFVKYKNNNKVSSFLLAAVFAILSFFVKQFGILLLVVYTIDLFATSKKRTNAVLSGIGLVAILCFYHFIFPKSSIMQSRTFDTNKITSIFETTLFLSQWLVYLVSFFLPLIGFYVYENLRDLLVKPIKQKFVFLSIALFVFLGISYLLQGYDYPYHANTFLNKGFFPGGLGGNKYHFAGFYDLFSVWKQVSMIIAALFIGLLAIEKRIFRYDFYKLFIMVYAGTLLVLPYIFDRYLIVLYPFFLIFVLQRIKNFGKILILGLASFTMFTVMLGYQFAVDYIGWQSYVWNRAEEVSVEYEVSKDVVNSSRAWNKQYEVLTADSAFMFSFDRPEVLQNESYELVEEKEINFPGSLWIEPKVYLYKAK